MVIASGQKVASFAHMGNIYAIILAGGKSSRMGEDKSELIYLGCNLVEHMQKVLQPLNIEKIYISGKDGVRDLVPNKGPLGGIHSVLKLLPDNSEVIICPVDMPLLSKKLLCKLLEARIAGDAVYFEGNIMPLKLRLSEGLRNIIEDVVLSGADNLSVKGVLNNLEVETINIPIEFEDNFFNANTPQQWKKIKMRESDETAS